MLISAYPSGQIVKILLRYGIGFSEFAEIVEDCVSSMSAATEFGIRGRPTNISRVAVMTGLTRKEVRRLRTKIEGGEDLVSVVKSTPMTEIFTSLAFGGRVSLIQSMAGLCYIAIRLENVRIFFQSLVKNSSVETCLPGAMRTELQACWVLLTRVDDKGELLS